MPSGYLVEGELLDRVDLLLKISQPTCTLAVGLHPCIRADNHCLSQNPVQLNHVNAIVLCDIMVHMTRVNLWFMKHFS